MDELVIEAFRGLGRLTFGSSRAECRAQLGASFSTFVRVDEGPETDSFDARGLQLTFDASEKLELIEASAPARVSYEGTLLVGRPAAEVVSELASKGSNGVEDDVGYDFPDLGFGLYSPDGEVEAVAVYRRGYYES